MIKIEKKARGTPSFFPTFSQNILFEFFFTIKVHRGILQKSKIVVLDSVILTNLREYSLLT